MEQNPAFSVTIIGGGFSGIMTLVQLVRKAEKKIHITLFYKSPPLASGTAFQTYSEQHLLNVAAKNMSAFPDHPGDFTEWVKGKQGYSAMEVADIGTSFLPRNLYGNYLEEILKNTLAFLPSHVQCDIRKNEVVSVKEEKNQFRVSCIDTSSVLADKVVLATGNQFPGPPMQQDHPFLESDFYFANPWDERSISNLGNNKPLLILGTGLTMVDVVLGLLEKKFTDKIIALSPKGFHILPHRPHEVYTDILKDIKPPYKLAELLSIFRSHIRKVKAQKRYGESVVDAFRSKTQEVWQGLSETERKRFMVHVRHLWGVARHRLPASIHEVIQELIKAGKLEILAGRIADVELHPEFAKVNVRLRKGQLVKSLEVQRVVNCTGPEADPAKFTSPLYRQMLSDGIITVDHMRLGIHASPNGEIYRQQNLASNKLFTIGSLLRGTLWETTAVPELRLQAEKIAGLILSK